MRAPTSLLMNAPPRNFVRQVSLSCLLVALVACCATASDFVAPKNFVAGESAAAMAAADFNGDGKLDIVTVNANLNIIFGNGNGTFQAPVAYSLNSTAIAVAVGDFNHDGHPDIAVGTNLGIGIFINTGTGTFDSPMYYEVNATSILAIGDINGDNHLDLLFEPNGEFEQVYYMLGNGDGTFNPEASISVPGCPTGLTTGDFNNDGKLDLAVPNAINCNNNDGYQISILKGNGDGTFQTALNYPTSGLYALNPAVADFNKDGNLDLAVVINGSNAVDIFLGNGDGTLQPAKSVAVDNSPQNLLIADFNGDGKPDIAVAHWDNGDVGVLIGNGLGSFTPSYYQAGSFLVALVAGDFRGTGQQDLVTNAASYTDGGNLYFLVNQSGTFHAAVDYHSNESATGLSIGDFNSDGFNDIIQGQSAIGTNVGVAVFLNNGKGGFKHPVITKVPSIRGSNGPYLATGDFNKDDKLDVAVAERAADGSDNVTILLGNGDGTFTTGANYDIASGYNAAPIVAGDFNHDGNVDLIAICGYQACLLLGNGNGTFAAPVAFNLGGSYYNPPTALAVGDINKDGTLDLAALIYGGMIAVTLGNGDGTFQAPSTYTDKQTPTALVLADFNKDGNLDLAVSDENTYFGVLLGNGNGTFKPEQHFPAGGSGVTSLVAADFDGDGNLDIGLVDGTFPCNLLVVHGKGDGTFKPPASYSIPYAANISAAASFTNSGAIDVVVGGPYGDMAVYLNARDF